MNSAALGLAACLAVGMSCACLAQDQMATPRFADTQIGFDPAGNYGNYTLTVAGPNGFHARAASKTGTPSIDLRRFGAYDDGHYTYQLTASTDDKIKLRTPLNDGRDGGPTAEILNGVSTSGTFNVSKGVIVKNDTTAPARRDPQN